MTVEILKAVRRLYGNYDYKLFNSYIYAWESDFFGISTSGYTLEVEVKQSRSDFFADFKKKDKHVLLLNYKLKHIVRLYRPFKPYIREGLPPYDPDTYIFKLGDSSYVNFCSPVNHIPNKFYYACPDGLIKLSEIPPYAGLLYFNPETKGITEVKKAPFLHKEKHKEKLMHTLLQKYYWMQINSSNKLLELNRGLTGHLDEVGERIMRDFIKSRHFD